MNSAHTAHVNPFTLSGPFDRTCPSHLGRKERLDADRVSHGRQSSAGYSLYCIVLFMEENAE